MLIISRCGLIRVLLRHWDPLVIPDPFCRSVSYIFWSVTLVNFVAGNYWRQSSGGRGREKPIFLLHFTSQQVADRRALCVTVRHCTDLALKRWFLFRYCTKPRRPFISVVFMIISLLRCIPFQVIMNRHVSSNNFTQLRLMTSHITHFKALDFFGQSLNNSSVRV